MKKYEYKSSFLEVESIRLKKSNKTPNNGAL